MSRTDSATGRIVSVIRKEGRHILRDPQTLAIVLLMPVVMMFLYGYALDSEITEVPIAVEDPAPTTVTRSLAAMLDASRLFRVVASERAIHDPEDYFRTRRVMAIVRLRPDFTRALEAGSEPPRVQVLIDGSDPNRGTILRNAFEPAIRSASLRARGRSMPEPVRIHHHVLYNPHQKSALYFVPGLVAIILAMICALLTSITLTRERELGTLSQLLISPLRPHEIVIGKIIPYVVLAAADAALILVIGRLAFDVRIAGDVVFLSAAILVYVFVSLSLGLLLSTLTTRQIHAMMASIAATVMPTMVLSGFVFPLRSIPVPVRYVCYAVPATYFLEIIRGIILKGVGAIVLWEPLVILLCFGIVLVIVSAKRFRTTL
jgi:ABC-2 type transport system permease protein